MNVRQVPITIDATPAPAPMLGTVTHSHAAMVHRLSMLKPPRVTGSRADAADCDDLADHLASVVDIFCEYFTTAIGDFNQYLPVGSIVELKDFDAGLTDIIVDYIAGPLNKRADAWAEDMAAAE